MARGGEGVGVCEESAVPLPLVVGAALPEEPALSEARGDAVPDSLRVAAKVLVARMEKVEVGCCGAEALPLSEAACERACEALIVPPSSPPLLRVAL